MKEEKSRREIIAMAGTSYMVGDINQNRMSVCQKEIEIIRSDRALAAKEINTARESIHEVIATNRGEL